jgi:amino acid transporter
VVYLGIDTSVRTQAWLLMIEMVILGVFVVVALVKVYVQHPAGSWPIQFAWLWPGSISSLGALSAGMIPAVFLYWGWDTAFSVSEETVEAAEAPGRAALRSTVVLAATYTLVAVAALAFAGPGTLTRHSQDALGSLGRGVLGGAVDKLLIVAVLTSSAATLLTTVLPNARTVYAMGRVRALPRRFGEINPRHRTPAFATVVVGVVSIGLYVILSAVSTNVLYDTITAIGLEVAFYYMATGLACLVAFRREMWRSRSQLLLVGVLPLLGTLILGYVMVRSVIDNFDPSQSYFGSVFGIGVVDVLGVGGLLLGVVFLLWQRRQSSDFFAHAEAIGENL